MQITVCPETVTERERFRREGRQAQQVVAAVDDHVDREIVAGVQLEVGPKLVAQGQSLPLQLTVERRVLDADQIGDLEQIREHLERIDPPEWGEHFAELEAEDWTNALGDAERVDRKSTRLNSSHGSISYAVFCLKKKKIK